MRKIDPADVQTQYATDLDDMRDHFRRLERAIKGTSHEQGDLSRLAESAFLSGFASFERFVSDLLLAYLNRDFTVYQRDLKRRISQSVDSKFGPWESGRTRFDSVKHVAVADLEGIVDPEGRNLTFKDAAQLKSDARCSLSPAHAARIQGLNNADERLIDTAKAIQNFIAHRSPTSKESMNSLLATVDQGGANAGLGRGQNEIHQIGAFLKSRTVGLRRVIGYLARLKAVGQAM